MKEEGKRITAIMEKHTSAVLLFFTFVLLSFTGTGIPFIVSAAGILLSITGFTAEKLKTDMWITGFMLGGLVLCGISSLRTGGNLREGYTELFAIYPVLYVLFTSLDREEGKLLRRLCILWSELVAAEGILAFILESFRGTAARSEGIIGNANEMGIFLVLAWFAVMCRRKEEQEESSLTDKITRAMEPLIPSALALTLSMGSFLSLCFGMIIYGWQLWKDEGKSLRSAAGELIALTGEMSLYIGTGMLMNLSERKMDVPAAVLLPAAYIVVLCLYGKVLSGFFRRHSSAGAVFTCAGAAGGIAAVLLRPGAGYNFMVRLDMMKNGLGYLMEHPLLGVGANQWRMLNLEEGTEYFRTWHIHNSFLHLAVELGIGGGILLAAIFIRALAKKENRKARPAVGAFILHNLIDTSFFYFADTTLLMFSNRAESGREKTLSQAEGKFFFGLSGLYFLYTLVSGLWTAIQGGL